MAQNILQDFEMVESKAWKERLEKDLKGITFEQLVKTDSNDLKVAPFYTADTALEYTPSFNHSDWGIVERIVVNEEKEANSLALHALNCGANVLQFVIAQEQVNWERLLNDVQVNFIKIQLRGNVKAWKASLDAFISQNSINASAVEIQQDDIYSILIGKAAKWETAAVADLFINGEHYFNAGASSSHQLAFLFAQLQEKLSRLTESELTKIRSVVVSVSVGTLFFEEIAKLRALRKGIALIIAAYNLPQNAIRIDVVSGTLYKSKADIYSNLLRDTIAGLAAVMGGCDNLCILPFDEKDNRGNERFSYRMAINQQLLMKEESYLDKIADVGNGSYFLEQRTQDLGTAAWEYFKLMEQAGGFKAYFESNKLQEQILKDAQALVEDYKSGTKIWIGVNKYPNTRDAPALRSNVLRLNEYVSPLNLEDYLGMKV
jgi:methylmalonyl-CoA mutase